MKQTINDRGLDDALADLKKAIKAFQTYIEPGNVHSLSRLLEYMRTIYTLSRKVGQRAAFIKRDMANVVPLAPPSFNYELPSMVESMGLLDLVDPLKGDFDD